MGSAVLKGRTKVVEAVPGMPQEVWRWLGRGEAVMCASWAGKRHAVLVLGVQRASVSPALVCVATRCGMGIDPALRDARMFSVSVVDESERVLLRRLREPTPMRGLDALDGVGVESVAGVPAVASASVALACEVVRHVDLEADHQLYVGRVVGWRVRDALLAAC